MIRLDSRFEYHHCRHSHKNSELGFLNCGKQGKKPTKLSVANEIRPELSHMNYSSFSGYITSIDLKLGQTPRAKTAKLEVENMSREPSPI